MTRNVIDQKLHFDASPDQVYSALTNSEQFAAFTNEEARIGSGVGEAFERFGGKISGRSLELVPNERIVEAWRAGNWPEGQYSIVRFELSEGAGGTDLHFTQAGHPEDAQDHLETGWHRMYWEPLQAFVTQAVPQAG